jgi:hypothetical protein
MVRIGGLGWAVSALLLLGAQQPPPGGLTPQEEKAWRAIVPGAPLPGANPAAPRKPDLGDAKVVQVALVGNSLSVYDRELQKLLEMNPPGARKYVVSTHWIAGGLTRDWLGDKGKPHLDKILALPKPVIALVTETNNRAFEIRQPDLKDESYRRFIEQSEQLADLLHADGKGVVMSYFSAHRYEPDDLRSKANQTILAENKAIGDLLALAGSHKKGYLKAGPAQFELNYLKGLSAYEKDKIHLSAEGRALAAECWYTLLKRELE